LAVAPGHETDIVNGRKPISDDLVYLFEIPSGRELGRLRGPDGSVDAVAFAPDGRSITTAGGARTARVWELATFGLRQTFPHARLVRTLSFSRDGRVLAVDGEDAPIDLWGVYGDRMRSGPKPGAAAVDRAWADLASPDAAVSFSRNADARRGRDETVRQLRERLKLTGQTAVARPALDALRAVRCVEMLEVIDTPDAQRMLSDLAHGPADARLTMEATRAVGRAKETRTPPR